MTDILSSSMTGGGVSLLAPDLTFPGDINNSGVRNVPTFDPQGSLTTALSLTGRNYVDLLHFSGLTSETITVKMTVDGVVIWDSTFKAPGGGMLMLIGSENGNGSVATQPIICNSTLLLEIQTLTDTAVGLTYMSRPIL